MLGLHPETDGEGGEGMMEIYKGEGSVVMW